MKFRLLALIAFVAAATSAFAFNSSRVVDSVFELTVYNQAFDPANYDPFIGNPSTICQSTRKVCVLQAVPSTLLVASGPNAGKPNVVPGSILATIITNAEASTTTNPYIDAATGVKVWKQPLQ